MKPRNKFACLEGRKRKKKSNLSKGSEKDRKEDRSDPEGGGADRRNLRNDFI